jgi:hypothetical protein
MDRVLLYLLLSRAKNEGLRRELVGRMEADQTLRVRLMTLEARQKRDDTAALRTEVEQVREKLRGVERENTARMKEVIGKYGWPGKTLAGWDGSEAAYGLVQNAHSDHAFQKRCLPLFAGAVKRGEADAYALAWLTDTVRVADGEKQVYGMILHRVGDKWEPFPIEDEEHVDLRRKELGLSTLAEHKRSIGEWPKPKTPAKAAKS